jgi:heterodisulfide reductase subunit B
MKNIYSRCNFCGLSKKADHQSICNQCRYTRYILKKNTTERSNDEIVEFIERIQKRDGWANSYEIFVELIGHYQSLYNVKKYDNHNPNKQLMYMWKDLIDWNENRKKPYFRYNI